MSEIESYLEQSMPSGDLEIPFEATSARGMQAVVVVPTAAHQEDISHLLNLYAQQGGEEPWQTNIYLNAPTTHARHPKIARNIDVLQQAGSNIGYSGELRWGLRLYDWGGDDGDFSFGKIKRDAWLHALGNLAGGGISDKTLGFSHDADMLDLSPGFIEKSLATAKREPSHFLLPKTQWGFDSSEQPEMTFAGLNRLAAYMGISEEAFEAATKIHHIWDGSAGFRLGSYALAGGFQNESLHTETKPLVDAISDNLGEIKLYGAIEGEFVVTSMRRYIQRTSIGESPFSLTDPSIGPNDKVRDNSKYLEAAEQNTRANLRTWCDEADDINTAVIIDKFAEKDGDDVDMRIDFYNELVNHGRNMLKVAGPNLDTTPQAAQPIIREIIRRVGVRANTILQKAS